MIVPRFSDRYDISMNYWLFKTEPSAFSYQTFERSPNRTAPWDGVRNFQARNYLRDDVSIGDEVFIYHSSIPEPAIVGIAQVVKPGYPDSTAWDLKSDHFDPKSAADNPIWFMVDVQAVRELDRPVRLATLKADPRFQQISLFSRPRLSIHPVTPTEWQLILSLSQTQ